MEYYDPESGFGTVHGGAPPPAPAYTPDTGTDTGTASVPTPGPAPSPAPSSVQTMAGYTPDYENLIRSSPSYIAAQNATTMSQEQASAKRRAAIRQAYVRYGGDLPAGFQDSYGDIDTATMDAGKGNQQSVLHGLADRYAQSTEQFKRGLAARGGLQSSELSYGSDQLDKGYAQQRYDAANQFTDSINQEIGGYAGVLGQNATTMAGAIGTAEANVYGNPAYRPSEPQFASYDASLAGQYGQPVYSLNGQLYDARGNPFTPPSAQVGGSTKPKPPVPGDWRDTTGTVSGYSPGVASQDLAKLYGGL